MKPSGETSTTEPGGGPGARSGRDASASQPLDARQRSSGRALIEETHEPPQVLVVDDDPAVVEWLCEALGTRGFNASGISDPREALSRVEATPFDLVISDVEMPGLRGPDLLRAILERRPSQLVLFITAYGSVELATASMRAGACDFLAKPFPIEALDHAIRRALADRTLRREIVRLRAALSPPGDTALVARSAAMEHVMNLARRAASSKATVLLTGETGVGKSVLARFIHQASERANAPFVELNGAALPASLAESELFGVRRGAFTDAREDRDGLFVSAGRGTLLLDELGEVPLEVQAKLLSVLETGVVRRVGGGERRTEARLITATNRSPEDELRAGRLRPDLYYRINVLRIEIPPLRARPDDILPLTDHLLERLTRKHGRPLVGISASALKKLVRHRWPGNVRELSNALERAVALADHDTILPEDIVLPEDAGAPALGQTLEEVEREHVARVLAACDGNKAAAAKQLGITRNTLYRKLGLRLD